MKIRRSAGKIAAVVSMAAVSAVPVAIVAGAPAGATSPSVPYDCALPFGLGNTSIPVTFNFTAPASATVGKPISVSDSAIMSIPGGLVTAADSFGSTGFTITQASFDLSITGATPSKTSAAATHMPFHMTIAQLGHPATLSFAPSTLTPASSPKGIEFQPRTFKFGVSIQGGSLNGTALSLSCTPHTPNTVIDTIPFGSSGVSTTLKIAVIVVLVLVVVVTAIILVGAKRTSGQRMPLAD